MPIYFSVSPFLPYMNNFVTYSSRKVQNSFFSLPEDDQQALRMFHETEARIMNNAIKSKIDSIIKEEVLAETPRYFKIAGYRLECENH